MAIDELMKEVARLSVPERIRLMGAIWDSLEEFPEAIEVTEAQRQELNRRLEAHERDPESGIPWETARRRLGSKG